jgi:Glycine cleavage system T protein (aminomethyltransferase)
MGWFAEPLGVLYGMRWPYKQHNTSRVQKLLPYHEELIKAGACFGQTGEYERPVWFAIGKTIPNYEYSFNYQNWYPSVEYECKNTVGNVGLYELSPFSKYVLDGEKVFEELQRLCTANFKNEIGKCTYTHMLTEGAGIETDLTVVCINKNHFRVISSADVRTHDKAHIKKHLSQNVKFRDVTAALHCLGVFGPKSREKFSKITNEDLPAKKGNSELVKI